MDVFITTHGADKSRHKRDHGRLHFEVKSRCCIVWGDLGEVEASVDRLETKQRDRVQARVVPDTYCCGREHSRYKLKRDNSWGRKKEKDSQPG